MGETWFPPCSLQVAERVDRRPVHAHFEVEVRPEAVSGTAHVADYLSLRDGLPVRDSDAGLVCIARRDAAAVVDEDEIAVPVHPTGIDDLARCCGVDRRAV